MYSSLPHDESSNSQLPVCVTACCPHRINAPPSFLPVMSPRSLNSIYDIIPLTSFEARALACFTPWDSVLLAKARVLHVCVYVCVCQSTVCMCVCLGGFVCLCMSVYCGVIAVRRASPEHINNWHIRRWQVTSRNAFEETQAMRRAYHTNIMLCSPRYTSYTRRRRSSTEDLYDLELFIG